MTVECGNFCSDFQKIWPEGPTAPEDEDLKKAPVTSFSSNVSDTLA